MKTSVSYEAPRNWYTDTYGIVPPLSLDGQRRRKFGAYFFFVSWDCLSLGLHVAFLQPNLEVHLPFGFIRVGWQKI